MIFKYLEFLTIDDRKIYRSAIPIIFKNHGKFIIVNALIDSGADFTVLPIELAGVLDIKLDYTKKLYFQAAGGNQFYVYHSKIKLEHVLRQSGSRSINWFSAVYFTEIQPTILLGQTGFFDHFKVIFDGMNKETQILQT